MLASSIVNDTANPVIATGAFTVGSGNPTSGTELEKIPLAEPRASAARAWGSGVWTCLNLKRLGSRQKRGDHCAVACDISSDPYTSIPSVLPTMSQTLEGGANWSGTVMRLRQLEADHHSAPLTARS